VVKADNSQSRGCGFEPLHRRLDGMEAKLAIAKKKIKVAKWGTPKKKYSKKHSPWLADCKNAEQSLLSY
jgi:hypothetical protein